MLGLPNGLVIIARWEPEWTSYFEQERKLILDLMKDHDVIVHHIGSTAIKHLDAKPVLDIAIEVKDFSAIKNRLTYLNNWDITAWEIRSFQTAFTSSRGIHGRIRFTFIEAEVLFYKNSWSFETRLEKMILSGRHTKN